MSSRQDKLDQESNDTEIMFPPQRRNCSTKVREYDAKDEKKHVEFSSDSNSPDGSPQRI